MANILDTIGIPRSRDSLLELRTEDLVTYSEIIERTQEQLGSMINRGDFSPERNQRVNLTISQLNNGHSKIVDVIFQQNMTRSGG